MGLFGKSKIAKNRQFTYMPKYYDERQERLDALLDKGNPDAEGMKTRISAGVFKPKSGRKGNSRGETKGIPLRVLLILIALVVITYLLLGLFLPSLEAFVK